MSPVIQQIVVVPETVKSAIDWISVGTAVTAVMGLMPNLAALAALVWTVLRVFYMIRDRLAGKALDNDGP